MCSADHCTHLQTGSPCSGNPQVCINGVTNVAQGKPTTSSGMKLNYESWRAVDGNPDTDLTGMSCTHTPSPLGFYQDDPWFEVDLEASYAVTTVRITNRNEVGSRLDGFVIKVGDEVCGSGLVVPEGATGDFLCDPALSGSTVRVDLPGKRRVLTVTTLPASAPHLIDVFLNRCASSRSLWLLPLALKALTAQCATMAPSTRPKHALLAGAQVLSYSPSWPYSPVAAGHTGHTLLCRPWPQPVHRLRRRRRAGGVAQRRDRGNLPSLHQRHANPGYARLVSLLTL